MRWLLTVGIYTLAQAKSPGKAIHQATELQTLHLPTTVALNLGPLDGSVIRAVLYRVWLASPPKHRSYGLHISSHFYFNLSTVISSRTHPGIFY